MNSLIKKAIRRSLGRKILPWTQLVTFVTEVEALLNERPITSVSDELDGPQALRPRDFLIPLTSAVLEEPEGEELYKPTPSEKLASLWWATNRALREFWQIWSRDYLILLRERTQTHHHGPRSQANFLPRVGQLVLVDQEDLPRNTWPLAKIISLDGAPAKARSAKLQMPNGRVWTRPINLLIPLEVESEMEKEEPDQAQIADPPEADPEKDQPSFPRKIKWADKPPVPDNLPQKGRRQRQAHKITGLTLLSLLCLTLGKVGAVSQGIFCDLCPVQ